MLSLSDLPLEVQILLVSYVKSQHDIGELCLVNKRFHSLCTSKLYSSITLDCGVNTLDKEYADLVEIQGFTTYVKRTNSIVKLFDQLNTDEKYGRLVHTLKLIEIPEEYYLLGLHVYRALPKLTALVVLDLIPLEINCRTLGRLNSKSLNCLKLSFDNLLSRKSLMDEERRCIVQSIKPMETNFQLHTLALNNVAEASEFDHFFKILVADSTKLENLQVTKNGRPEYNWINGRNNRLPHRPKIFHILDIRHLKSLTLAKHIFSSDDARLLPHLKHLESLTLLKVSKAGIPTQVSIFNEKQGLQFDKLTHLRIQMDFTLIISFGKFFANCQTPRLQNLVIDLNPYVFDRDADYIHVTDSMFQFDLYIKKIRSLRNQLITLSFVVDPYDAADGVCESLLEMFNCRYPKLRNLTISASYHRFTDLRPDYIKDGNVCFPNLEVFCLLGETERSRNYSSGPKFPGVYDYWFHLQHVPQGLMEGYFGALSKVKYIKIGNFPFEIIRPKGRLGNKFTVVAERRHTLNQWLDLKTGRNQVYSEKF